MSATYTFNAQEIYDIHYVAIYRGLKRFIVIIQNDLRDKLSQEGTGRQYVINKSGTVHTASAPGEPPAVNTGLLRNSVATAPVVEKTSRDEIEMRLTDFAPYGATLERGTSKMAARPWVKPVLNDRKPELKSFLEKSISNAMKRATLKKTKKV